MNISIATTARGNGRDSSLVELYVNPFEKAPSRFKNPTLEVP